MKKEIWKSIPGFPGYEASSLGRLRSKRSGKYMIMNYRKIDALKYHRVILYPGRKHRSVHRLVAIAFLGLKKGLTINHIDGDKGNNKLDNLEWVSIGQNHRHAFQMGLRPRHNTSKLSRVDRDMIRAWHHAGFTKKSIARAFKIHDKAVQYALVKEHYTFKEKNYNLFGGQT